MSAGARAGIGMTSARTRQRLLERLRHAGIRSQPVLDAIYETPRHLFVDEALASRAYEDTALPIGFGQTISQPLMAARMCEAISVLGRPGRVLEVGTGSGYQTALLARLAHRVYSVERIAPLVRRARELLRGMGLNNVYVSHGDGYEGWAQHGPYDGIVVSAAAPVVPASLLRQLAQGGRLVAPVGTGARQELVLIENKARGFDRRSLGAASFVPLIGGVS